MAKVKIEGLDDCLRCLDAAPANVVKMTKAALRSAAKVTRQQIKTKMPFTFGRLVKYSLRKQPDGTQSLLVGLFNKKQTKNPSSEIPDWFKAYWKNYGTLKRRDPNHDFMYPIREGRAKRNKEGQMPERFFEAAAAGWEGPFISAFEQAMADQQDKLYDR